MNKENPYNTLGVNQDASKDDIKKAYRKQASKKHPDKGGNVEEFKQLQVAYDLLSDDAKRAKFDATGKWGSNNIDNFEVNCISKAFSIIDSIIQEILNTDEEDIGYTNVIGIAINTAKKTGIILAADKVKSEKTIKNINKVIIMFKKKSTDSSCDFVTAGFNSIKEDILKGIERLDRDIKENKRVIVLLEGYEYSYDIKPSDGVDWFNIPSDYIPANGENSNNPLSDILNMANKSFR